MLNTYLPKSMISSAIHRYNNLIENYAEEHNDPDFYSVCICIPFLYADGNPSLFCSRYKDYYFSQAASVYSKNLIADFLNSASSILFYNGSKDAFIWRHIYEEVKKTANSLSIFNCQNIPLCGDGESDFLKQLTDNYLKKFEIENQLKIISEITDCSIQVYYHYKKTECVITIFDESSNTLNSKRHFKVSFSLDGNSCKIFELSEEQKESWQYRFDPDWKWYGDTKMRTFLHFKRIV